jgi:hypothetical protein
MLENIMHKMGGTSLFGIISICIFFAFFIGMLVWAARLKKSYLKSMCELPLDKSESPRQPGSGTNQENDYE